MKYHKRYHCRECHREWLDPKESRATGGDYVNSWPVSMTGNPDGENCPICGSPEVEEIMYRPFMEGLDIPRIEENGKTTKDIEYERVNVLPRKRTSVTIPGRTGADAMLFRETAQSTPHKMNVTRNEEEVINPRGTPIVLASSGLASPSSSSSDTPKDNEDEFDVLKLLKGVQLSEKP